MLIKFTILEVDDMSQRIPGVSLKRNRSERLPCVLVLDGSDSMRASGAIDELNEGVALLAAELKANEETAYGVQLAMLRFGDRDSVEELSGFTDVADFFAPTVRARGSTPLGLAVAYAMDLVERQKGLYRAHGIGFKRPLIWVFSDGAPTDDTEAVAAKAQAAQLARKFTLYTVGIGRGADLGVLSSFVVGDRCFHLGQRSLVAMFEFLSASVAAGSQAAAGQQIQLPPLPPGVLEV